MTRVATAFSQSESYAVFELGPFQIVEERAGMVRLQARSRRAIDFIELVEVATDEQWRRLLARDIDVVPMSDNIHRARLTDIGSIRMVDLQNDSAISIVFGPDRFGDLRLRHAIARVIDREAVAEVVCGSSECAASSPLPSQSESTTNPA